MSKKKTATADSGATQAAGEVATAPELQVAVAPLIVPTVSASTYSDFEPQPGEYHFVVVDLQSIPQDKTYQVYCNTTNDWTSVTLLSSISYTCYVDTPRRPMGYYEYNIVNIRELDHMNEYALENMISDRQDGKVIVNVAFNTSYYTSQYLIYSGGETVSINTLGITWETDNNVVIKYQ